MNIGIVFLCEVYEQTVDQGAAGAEYTQGTPGVCLGDAICLTK